MEKEITTQNKNKVLEWIKKEKLILQSLINHRQANVFMLLFHYNAYSLNFKDWWNLFKIKKYIKRLDKLEEKLNS